MSNFSSAAKVQATIRASDDVEWRRGQNRVKIDNFANCFPPLDEEKAKRIGIKINTNFGEMMILLAHARRQYLNAFWGQPYFFKVKMPYAPSEYQSEWESFITEEVNRVMRKSNDYFELHNSRWAAVAAHGMGPQMWFKSDPWLPEFVALADIRIPTDTTCDFRNLDWFNWRKFWTPLELVDEVFPADPKDEKPEWDKKAVAGILHNYKQINVDYAPNHYDWMTSPEKLANLVRQDGGYWSSSAVPAIPLNHFYFKDESEKDNDGWFMRIVAESGAVRGGAPQKFLWTSDRRMAKHHKNLLQVQFGDLNNAAPFKVNAVRSLGLALMEPCFYQNLTRCRMLQHLNDQFNILLRITDPPDKARATIQEFNNLGVLRTGVSIVPQAERHQVEPDLIEMAMGQLKQLMQEASASYTSNVDTGTQREQTAYETSVKIQQVNAMTAGLLMKAGRYATNEYEEILRRFFKPGTTDEDCKKFQQRAKRIGLTQQWLDVDDMDVQVSTPLGMGNPALAMTEAQQLMQISGSLDATAQQEIKHEYVLAVTGDPRKAARLAPLGKARPQSEASRDAQGLFGSLMTSVPIPIQQGFSPIDQFDALEPLLAGKIALCEQRTNTADYNEATGMMNVSSYMKQLIQALSQDPQQAQRVKKYGDSIGQLDNLIKGLAERGHEQQQSQQQNGNGAEDMMKLQFSAQQAALKLHSKQVSDQQKLKQKDDQFKQKQAHQSQEFVQSQRRQDAETFAEIQRGNISHKVDEAQRLADIKKQESDPKVSP